MNKRASVTDVRKQTGGVGSGSGVGVRSGLRGAPRRRWIDRNEIHAWLDLVEIGVEDRAFAGAARGIAEDLIGYPWEVIEAHAAALAADP